MEQRRGAVGARLQPAGPVFVAPRDQPALPGARVAVPAGHLRVLARFGQETPRDGHQRPQGSPEVSLNLELTKKIKSPWPVLDEEF